MLISIDDLKSLYTELDFSKYSEERLERSLQAIETTIRRLTHNNFQNRAYKFMCPSENGSLYCSESNYLKVDDTIQITGSKYNNGLYTIVSIKNNVITLDKPLVNGIFNAICKVEYPFDIVDGAVKLLDWELNQKRKDKQGITSESISRHSVSYKQYDESNMTEGYPSELMAFVKKYVEWRT